MKQVKRFKNLGTAENDVEIRRKIELKIERDISLKRRNVLR